MPHEVKKVTSIINELVTMMLLNGAEEVDVNILRKGNKTEIRLTHHNCCYSDNLIEKISYNLKTQRQYEVEGYYWQLVAEDETGDELHLVGAMIDDAKVEKVNNNLNIFISRTK